MISLISAYQVLGNEKQRMNYDRLNKDLITREKVVANLKKITKEYMRIYTGIIGRTER